MTRIMPSPVHAFVQLLYLRVKGDAADSSLFSLVMRNLNQILFESNESSAFFAGEVWERITRL